MGQKGNRPGREKIIMLSASGLIITALTFTGIYMNNGSSKNKGDGYRINLDELNKTEKTETKKPVAPKLVDLQEPSGAVSTEKVENPGLIAEEPVENYTDLDADSSKIEELGDNDPTGEELALEGDMSEQDGVTASTESVQESVKALPNLNFGAESTLNWPVVGDVLLNYSMDKTIYYPTLDVYKYNPAIVIGAPEGTMVTAAANAVVTRVFYDEEIGNAVSMNIGNGYELTYGQLRDITVKEGDGLYTGEIVGYIDVPTKYYSLEGSNIYVKLTKDGVPVNPLSILE